MSNHASELASVNGNDIGLEKDAALDSAQDGRLINEIPFEVVNSEEGSESHDAGGSLDMD